MHLMYCANISLLQKDDNKQKRIDSFFERINKTSQRESDHPDHAATLADESKATKPEKEGMRLVSSII